jgi:hypothetical protein
MAKTKTKVYVPFLIKGVIVIAIPVIVGGRSSARLRKLCSYCGYNYMGNSQCSGLIDKGYWCGQDNREDRLEVIYIKIRKVWR